MQFSRPCFDCSRQWRFWKLSPWQVPQQEEGAGLPSGLGTHTNPHRLVGDVFLITFISAVFFASSAIVWPVAG